MGTLSARMSSTIQCAVQNNQLHLQKVHIDRLKLSTYQGSFSDEDEIRNEQTETVEQYTRRDNIKVAGVQEAVGKKIISLAKELDVSLVPSDISTVHRVCKTKQGNPRPIICRFTARHKKDELMKNKKKLKDMPSHKGKTYINEGLTNLRYKLSISLCKVSPFRHKGQLPQ